MLQPTKNRILLKRTDVIKKTSGGLHIPEEAQKTLPEGEVLSVGPDVKGIKIGDIVSFSKHGGAEVGAEVMIKESDILGVKTAEGLKAITDRIFIKRSEAKKVEGSIYIPDNYREELPRGLVVGVGPNVENVEVGEMAFFNLHDGLEVDDILVMREEDIIAVRG